MKFDVNCPIQFPVSTKEAFIKNRPSHTFQYWTNPPQGSYSANKWTPQPLGGCHCSVVSTGSCLRLCRSRRGSRSGSNRRWRPRPQRSGCCSRTGTCCPGQKSWQRPNSGAHPVSRFAAQLYYFAQSFLHHGILRISVLLSICVCNFGGFGAR